MELSTHKCEVVEVSLRRHENADSLSIVEIFGYTVVVRTADWQGKSKGIYIVPDSIVDTTRTEFSCLKREGRDKERIKVKRLRGVLSMGLLIPCPESAQLGEDWAERLGVTRYEPELTLDYEIGEDEHAPNIFVPKYDVDTIYRYSKLFTEGESVFIQEKINGQNARYVFVDEHMYCGSRTRWKKQDTQNAWWKTFENTLGIQAFCEANPDYILFGESYGNVGGMRYGVDKLSFAAFDILYKGRFLDSSEFMSACEMYSIPIAPILHKNFQFNLEEIKKMANGASLVSGANHCKEGVVVRPIVERSDSHLGRIILKCVGEDYYNLKEKK